jgi:LemA protein
MAAYLTLGALILVALWAIWAFNALVRARNRVEEAWSGVDVQLRRRHDLVPNLVEAVRAYAEHERAALVLATKASFTAGGARSRAGRARAESALSAALTDVLALGEEYPALRGSEGFVRLQSQLIEIESEIQYAQRLYNSNVQAYNTLAQSLPTSIVAALGSFRARAFVEIESTQRAVPAALEQAV